MKKLLFIILFLILFSSFVSGALIRGSVYDMSLDKKSHVIVTVNSNPKQAIIAENGNYEFSLPTGNYTIKADYYENQVLHSSSNEPILINNDKGFYKLDLVLLPIIENEVTKLDLKEESYLLEITLVFLLLIILVALGYFIYYRKNKQFVVYSTVNQPQVSVGYEAEEDEVKPEIKDEKSFHESLVEQIINFIKDQGGSTTQKEIRKNITSSEAKISLVVAELVHKGTIDKIKKGRGNIIVLKDESLNKELKE